MENNKPWVNPGYSTVKEKDYVMNPFCEIPTLKLMTPEIKEGYDIVLEQYKKWLKVFGLSPNASTTYPLFYDHARYGQKSKIFSVAGCKGKSFEFTNRFKRTYICLINSLKVAIREVALQATEPEPAVSFSLVRDGKEEGVLSQDRSRSSNEANLARSVQKEMKDAQHSFLSSLNKPVLDLGGGRDNLKRAMEKKDKRDAMEVKVIDIVKCPTDDINKLKLEDFSGHHILSNHSSYHIHPNKWVEIIKQNPSGMALVVDSDQEEFEEKGEDYYFKGRRIHTLNLQAYEVSGNLFNIKTTRTTGRIFSNEIWYTRKQWADWGFDLYMLPGVTSPFVLNHVVLFNKGVVHRPFIHPFTPLPIRLSESEQSMEKKKHPLVHQFGANDRARELAALYGQPIYQTPKVDGISLKLSMASDCTVNLSDRTGVCYKMKDMQGRNLVATAYYDISLLVEILPVSLVPKENVKVGGHQYQIYLTQVMKGFSKEYLSFGDEMTHTVDTFNTLFRGFKPLGRKEAWLTRNSVLKWSPKLPSDGVVYVPAIATSSWLDPYHFPVHSFLKPFAGTDTSPYIIGCEQIANKNKTPFKVYYRDDGANLLQDCPYSEHIRSVFKSNIVNPNDFFGDQHMSPLLYEGYMVPAGLIDKENAFVVTHVRGDKTRRECFIKQPENVDWLESGRFAFTRFGANAKEVLNNFLVNLNSSRRVKILPSFAGTYSGFTDTFVQHWLKGTHYKTEYLNKFVVDGEFRGSADELVKGLKMALDPTVALHVASTLFRYHHVRRRLDIQGHKIFTWVTFHLANRFKPPDATMLYDAFGASSDTAD